MARFPDTQRLVLKEVDMPFYQDIACIHEGKTSPASYIVSLDRPDLSDVLRSILVRENIRFCEVMKKDLVGGSIRFNLTTHGDEEVLKRGIERWKNATAKLHLHICDPI